MEGTAFGHEQMTEEEEKLRIAAEERDREAREQHEAEARELLARPSGGIAPSKAELQATGGSKEIRADQMPAKDDLLEITLRGWVKQIQDVTVKQGENAKRVAVFVTDEIVAMRLVEAPQLAFAEGNADATTEHEELAGAPT